MNNWFEVGEVVILQSIRQPESNGEYTVETIIPPKALHKCRLTGQLLINSSEQVSYLLDVPIKHKTSEAMGSEASWLQSALRKKYKGSEMRYNEMIKSLNVDIVEVV